MNEIPMTARPRLGVQARLYWDSIREKQILLLPEGVLVLNETAAAILALCDGQHTVATIIDTLIAQYKHAVAQDVLTFLERLRQKRVMEFDDE